MPSDDRWTEEEIEAWLELPEPERSRRLVGGRCHSLLTTALDAQQKLKKVVRWLDRRAEQAEQQAANCSRFPSLAEAAAADAKAYRATIKDIKEAIHGE